jgi:hypothetical protein
MPFVSVTDPRISDVILEELPNLASRGKGDSVTLTGTTGTYKQGHVLFRARSADPTAQWDVVDANADIAITNEYAILIGDNFKVTETIALTQSVAKNVLVLKRNARVKEQILKDIYVTGGLLTNTQFGTLKHVLALYQNILVEDSLVGVSA